MYARVRTDNMSGTTLGKDLVSLVYTANIENGNILQIGGYVGGREVRQGSVPSTGAALANLALVASEEVVKDKATNTLGEFINEKGDYIRGYRLTPKDLFSVTTEAVTGTAAVGNVAFVKGSTKINIAATVATDGIEIGSVIAIEGDWIVIEVAG